MRLLVTGGLGFIGSHFVVEASNKGFDITIIDDLSNSSLTTLKHIQALSKNPIKFQKIDIRNTLELNQLFSLNIFDAVIHFAGLKSVAESVAHPLDYYNVNVIGSWNILKTMQDHKVHKIIFSSSATVYGVPVCNPYTEAHRKLPVNPYGKTKSIVEDMLIDLCLTNSKFRATTLRYFNPIGAHPSGLIGENPKGIPNNLMPYITKVANKELPHLNIFGNNYLTKDGTGVRDYIHVMDLVAGHLSALNYMQEQSGFEKFNLGSGQGISVLEVVNCFEKTNGVKIPIAFEDRRDGDLAAYWADAEKAKRILGWQTKLTIEQMVRDTWNWAN